MKKSLTVSLAALAATLGATHALADTQEATAVEQAKVSLVEAIQAAEKKVGGVAYSASYDDDSFQKAYEVDVIADSKPYDVQVSAENGEVLSSREDLDD